MPATRHIQQYLDHLTFQKRYARHTIVSYRNDLETCFAFINTQFSETESAQVKATYIKTWLASLKEGKMTSKSINRKISSLKSFFKFLLRNGLIKASPMATILSPKTGRRLPQYVETKDIDRLFTAIEFQDNWQGLTEKLLISILYNTGIRRAELIGLKESNFDVGNSTLKVYGKGGKERVVPISNALQAAIQNYLLLKEKSFTEADRTVLLVKEDGRPLYPKYVYLVVKKYLGFVTTIAKKSPHILRHSFATHLANNGAELNAIKELLGHASLASTQIYTHNTIEKLKDIHKNAHPKA
ncbi:MAG: tyrosine-type recombinase/integrase [Ferruginibacter sp.]